MTKKAIMFPSSSRASYILPLILCALAGISSTAYISSTPIVSRVRNWVHSCFVSHHQQDPPPDTTPQAPPDSNHHQSKDLINLLYSIAEDQAKKEGFIHRGITCNHCNTSPIRGVRFKCSNCVDFDVCENCEALDLHTKTHVFIKIRVPIPPLANPRTALLRPFYPGTPSFDPSETLSPDTLTELQATTHFDRLELAALHDQYLSLATSHLGIPRSIYDQALGPLGLEKNLITDRIFHFFDRNKDTHISFTEFVHGLSILCKGTLDEKIIATFNGYDLDSDGFITRVELHAMFKAYFHLSMELVRDVVKAMEEEMMAGFDDDTTKPVSASFTAPIPSSTDPPGDLWTEKEELGPVPASPMTNSSSYCSSINNYHSDPADDPPPLSPPPTDLPPLPPTLSIYTSPTDPNPHSQSSSFATQRVSRQFTSPLTSPHLSFSPHVTAPNNDHQLFSPLHTADNLPVFSPLSTSDRTFLPLTHSANRPSPTHHDRLQPVMEQMSQEAIAEMVDKVFTAMDTSESGLVGFDAFKAFVEIDPTLITWFETLGSVF